MQATGRIEKVERRLNGKMLVTLEMDLTSPEPFNDLSEVDPLEITIEKPRRKRSLNANALLWQCIGQIAADRRADKWEIYLMMLRRYGQYTYICIKPAALEAMKRQWRELEVIGDIDIHGERAIQCLCYYGSSTYDTREFSVLLDGVISEMKELGLPLPMPREVKAALDEWEKRKMGFSST